MKKYGLQLRGPIQQKKAQNPARPQPSPFFNDDDDDDVEREIEREATKKKQLRDVEALHKKALEEDPSVFDYDGVYDQMKEKKARPIVEDRQKREARYIPLLKKTAEAREKEQDVIYERKLLKERSKEDHLYSNKEKFVTSAYKKKLAEQAKWLEEEHLQQLREAKEDVTKKDMTDFYFNLHQNVAFGAESAKSNKPCRHPGVEHEVERREAPESSAPEPSSRSSLEDSEEKPMPISIEEKLSIPSSLEKAEASEAPSDEKTRPQHKRSEDAVAAAKERYLARKKAKEGCL